MITEEEQEVAVVAKKDNAILSELEKNVAARVKAEGKAVVIGTLNELIAGIAKIQELSDRKEAFRIELDEQWRPALEMYAEKITPVASELVAYQKAVESFALLHRDSLLLGSDMEKTVSFPTGEIEYRSLPASLRMRHNKSEAEAADLLTNAGFDELTKTERKLIKEAVKVNWDKLQPILSKHVSLSQPGETVIIRPTKTEV